MDECIFCKIANKTISSYIVYEDNDIIAVLDIFPPNKGSVLIFPKLHIEDFSDINDNLNGKLFTLTKIILSILKNKLKFTGANIIVSYGDTGLYQSTKHFVIHIIPRYDGDNLNLRLRRYREEPQSLEELKNYILNELIRISQENLKKETKVEKKVEEKKEYKNVDVWFRQKI
ncbi:MAG: HIT family protein [Nanopusillaceae archaeon]